MQLGVGISDRIPPLFLVCGLTRSIECELTEAKNKSELNSVSNRWMHYELIVIEELAYVGRSPRAVVSDHRRKSGENSGDRYDEPAVVGMDPARLCRPFWTGCAKAICSSQYSVSSSDNSPFNAGFSLYLPWTSLQGPQGQPRFLAAVLHGKRLPIRRQDGK